MLHGQDPGLFMLCLSARAPFYILLTNTRCWKHYTVSKCLTTKCSSLHTYRCYTPVDEDRTHHDVLKVVPEAKGQASPEKLDERVVGLRQIDSQGEAANADPKLQVVYQQMQTFRKYKQNVDLHCSKVSPSSSLQSVMSVGGDEDSMCGWC